MNKIARLLKTSAFLYTIYFYVVSAFLKFLGLFIPTNNKLILFNCFGGKKYDDSPKAVYEFLIADKRFADCEFCWAISDPSGVTVPGRATVVKADTFKYFVTTLKARVWVTNSSMERGLDFKKKKTFCLNTWHGTPIKVMGDDIKTDNQSFKGKVLVRADIMCAQSQYDVDVFSRAFRLPVSSLKITGLPRNDVFDSYTQDERAAIRAKLGIPDDRIVLLYAPTFREYTTGQSNEIVLDIPMDLKKWQADLDNRFTVLFRAHYEVARHMNVEGYPLFTDVSSYPDLNELMIASDALITDYSSVCFDYAIMDKPMYCFAYDYDDYVSNRGMYIDLREEFPGTIHYDEDSLLEDILHYEESRDELSRKTAEFRNRYVSEYGHGASSCADILCEELGLS